jgi:hypothetical protein
MKTLISTVKIPTSQSTATVGTAVPGINSMPLKAHIHIFDNKMFYKVIDVFQAINDVVVDATRFNPTIHALIRTSKHVTGMVLCTNVGVFADIVALKHLVNDHYIVNEGKTQLLYRIGDQGALISILDCDDNTGTGFDKAVSQLNAEWFKEIDPRKLFYSRNTPTELTRRVKATKSTNAVESTVDQSADSNSDYVMVSTDKEITVSVTPETTNVNDAEKAKTPTTIEEALSAFISSIVSGKEVEFKFMVKVK